MGLQANQMKEVQKRHVLFIQCACQRGEVLQIQYRILLQLIVSSNLSFCICYIVVQVEKVDSFSCFRCKCMKNDLLAN